MAQKKVTVVKKTAAGKDKKTTKGATYTCDACGLTLRLDDCGDAVFDLVCCDLPMKAKSK